jgi:site-specific recombinase XerD
VNLGQLKSTSERAARAKFKSMMSNVNLVRPIPEKPLSNHTAWKMLTMAALRAGMKALPGRALRHSCATHLWENGADIRVVQEILGHSCLSSTQIYVRLSNRSAAKTFKKMHPRGA